MITFPNQQFLDELKERQKSFFQRIEQIHIFTSAEKKIRNKDVYFPFRQDSSFFYLTGFPEAESVAVFEPNGTYTLFVQEKIKVKELWTGFCYGLKQAQEIFGVDKIYSINQLEEMLPKIIVNASIIMPSEKCLYITELRNMNINILFNMDVIAQMRLIKSPWEIQQIAYACQLSSKAHKKMIENRLGLQYEYEFEAIFRTETMKEGALEMAYPAIVASGKNACTLHYSDNNCLIPFNDLVLIDAGCEWKGYASDITRTFPIGEKFSVEQRAVYEIVLAAQQVALDMINQSSCFIDIHQKACIEIILGLKDLGILNGSIEENLVSKKYLNYFPHGIGHHLGLDVHDIIAFNQNQKKLEEGMVFTIEPGLYFNFNDNSIPKNFRGIGIRIEDDILMTKNGYKNLVTAPKAIVDIEIS